MREQAQVQENPTIWPWLLGLALLLGGLALFLLRRGRGDMVVHHRTERGAAPEPVRADPEPVMAAAEVPATPVAAAAPLSAAAPLAAAAPFAPFPSTAARPWLDLKVRPARAGVTGEDAVVEFELAVENQGSAPAFDVRISTWLVPAGPGREGEMERMLSERDSAPASDAETLPEITIEPGQGQRIETAVHLPTSRIDSDSVLPVLFAEARYRLPDGGHGRTSASFAVGVPDGEELAYFGLDNPSGLHEGVVARELGEPERA